MRYFFLMLILLPAAVFGQESRRDIPSVIPEPESMVLKPGYFTITDKTLLVCASSQDAASAALFNEFLYTAYGYRLKTVAVPGASGGRPVIVIRRDQSMAPESYRLTIGRQGVQISGGAAGIFYGLQTLQQLMPLTRTAVTRVRCLEINDRPRFKYRGLMLDVSRHFFSVSYIKKFLNVMAQYKLNNFHWHLTDDQGWRIEIEKYPRLQQVSAWRKVTPADSLSEHISNNRYGGFYTQQQVKEIVAYAAQRQINIIPEIEMPGHSVAALAAYPEFGCSGGPYQVLTSGGINKDVYCAGNEVVFKFLQDVIDEIAPLFPSRYIHIGGDETPKDRWKACPKCQARMKQEGLKDEHELQSYFVQRMEKHVMSKGKRIIGWDEILEGGLAPNATVMSWRGETGGIAAARLKHDVIMSPYTYAYLDYYQGSPAAEPLAIGGFLPLASVYQYEPLSKQLSPDEHQYIKGVQANTWAEYIATEKHMDYMVYPRALALAEIGWSQAKHKDFVNFSDRLFYQLNRLDKQKVNFRIPEPIGFKDAVTTAGTLNISLKPAVKGANVYYTTDGSSPTQKSQKINGIITLSLTDNIPVVLKVLTVLESGRQSAVYTANYIKKPGTEALIKTIK